MLSTFPLTVSNTKPNVIRFGMRRHQGQLIRNTGASSSTPPPFADNLLAYIQKNSPLNANLFPTLNMMLACLHHNEIFQAIPYPDKEKLRGKLVRLVRELSQSDPAYRQKPLTPEMERQYRQDCAKPPIEAYNKLLESDSVEEELDMAHTKVLLHVFSLEEALSLEAIPPSIPDVFEKRKPHIESSSSAIHATIQPATSAPKGKAPLQRLQDYKKLETALKSQIFGQDHALEKILGAVRKFYVMETPRFKARFKAGMPRSVMLLVGPSGVGKTQTVKILQTLGNRDVVRLDGESYSDDIKTNKITGSAPGYAGHGEPTLVDELIRKCKHAKDAGNDPPILLIDELDKAAPRFFTIWNAALSEGRMERQHVLQEEGKGSGPPQAEQLKVDFRNMDIVCTSNFAQQEIINILQGKEEISSDDESEVLKAVEKEASDRKGVMPDFWGRFTAMIPFKPLSVDNVKRIVKNLADAHAATYLEDNGVRLDIHPSVFEQIIHGQDIVKKGCRGIENKLEKIVDDSIWKPVFALMEKGRFQPVASPEQADRIEIQLDEAGQPKAFLS